MYNYKKTNLFLILITIGLITVLGILSFSSIQAENEETKKIDLFFNDFEDLNQYQSKDSVTPNVITYTQLKSFDKNDNYIHNRKDISKSVSTYTKENIPNIPKKHIDISNRVSTYSSLQNEVNQKKYDVSKLVTIHTKSNKNNKKPRQKIVATTIKQKKKLPKKETIKIEQVKNKISTKNKVSPKKTVLITNKPIKTTKKVVPKKINSVKTKPIETTKKKVVKTIKPTITKPTTIRAKKSTKNQTIIPQKTPIFKKENTTIKTLHYAKKELNTATNINYVESAPVYPDCQNKLTENDKKACLLTNVSKFVLDHFDSNIGKKSGLKKGFYEIRVLFIIDEKGISKTYKVLGNYQYSVKKEIEQIINQLPKMIPGKSNGKNVPVKYSVKVLFEVK